jgi:nucleoid-associated protein YgaU
MKRTLAVVSALTLGLGLGACSSDEADTSTEAATATEAASESTEAAATATEAPATEAVVAPTEAAAAPTEAAAAGTEAAAGAGAPAYVLKEWTLEGSATLPPGLTQLSVTNSGKFAHEIVVIKDTTYEDAPKDDLGTVLEDQLPAGSVLGYVEKIEAGKTVTLEVDLVAGKYLFVCNIAFGPNSHAGKGQRLNVTVA